MCSRASEQSVINALIDAIDTGEASLKQAHGSALLAGYRERDWGQRRIVDSGGVLPPADTTLALADEDTLLIMFEESRVPAIMSGASLTAEEESIWKSHIEDLRHPEDPDDWGNRACVILEVQHTDGRRAYLAVREWFVNSGLYVQAYRTYSECVNALAALGLLTLDSQVAWKEHYLRSRQ
jgi:hypothetical protein